MRRLLFLAALLAAAACDTDPHAARTYPGASDAPRIAPSALGDAAPGRYTLDAAVVGISVCGPTGDCIGEAALTLAAPDAPAADSGPVWAEAPGQFEVGRRGTFTVDVRDAAGGEDDAAAGAARWVELVGYDWR